jgi:hypothetical protein
MDQCPTTRTDPNLRFVRWRFQTHFRPFHTLQTGLRLASDSDPLLDT